MELLGSMLTLAAGLSLRLALPVAITVLLVYYLRRLDTRWQAEAGQQPADVQTPRCWKIKNCPPEERKLCPAASSDLACWQVFRLHNGHLHEPCLACTVFLRAPVHPLPQTI